MKLSEMVIKYREEHDLSQRQFAQKCDLSNGYISMLEKNLNPSTGLPLVPTVTNLKKLATGMGMTLQEMFPLLDDVEVNIDELENIINSTTKDDSGIILEAIRLFASLSEDKKREGLNYLKYLAGKPENP